MNDALDTKQTTILLNHTNCNISEISQINISALILRFCKRTPDDDRLRSKREIIKYCVKRNNPYLSE